MDLKPFTIVPLQYIPNAAKIVDDESGLIMGVVEPIDGEWRARGVTHEDVDTIFTGDTEEEAAEKMYDFWAAWNGLLELTDLPDHRTL